MTNDSSGDSKQYDSTVKMILSAYYTLSLKNIGVTATEIADYLRKGYGDVWRVNTLVAKAQDTLRRSASLGFLEKRGDRYIMIDKRIPRVRQRGRPHIGQRRTQIGQRRPRPRRRRHHRQLSTRRKPY